MKILHLVASLIIPYATIRIIVELRDFLVLSVAFPLLVMLGAVFYFTDKKIIEEWYSSLSETGKDKAMLLLAGAALTFAYTMIFFREWVAITNKIGIYADLGFTQEIAIQPPVIIFSLIPYVVLFYAYRSLDKH